MRCRNAHQRERQEKRKTKLLRFFSCAYILQLRNFEYLLFFFPFWFVCSLVCYFVFRLEAYAQKERDGERERDREGEMRTTEIRTNVQRTHKRRTK